MNCTRFITALSVALLAVATPQAKALTEAQAVRCLIGEAGNQGERGMQAVGEVLRRRGSIRGFYGYKAPHVDKQPKWVWEQARKAWEQSRTSNLTKGATHFEGTAFKTPYWAKGLKPVVVIGQQRFYKLKRG
jgi:hypothetical protein